MNLLACASGHAANVFSIGAPRGGTLENPQFLYTVEEDEDEGNMVGVGGAGTPRRSPATGKSPSWAGSPAAARGRGNGVPVAGTK